jgi:hypothetical protein
LVPATIRIQYITKSAVTLYGTKSLWLNTLPKIWGGTEYRLINQSDMIEKVINRYADDFVCAFQCRTETIRFYKVLPKRLEKFGLSATPEKTRLMRFSRFHPSMGRRIIFLGFETYWTHDLKGEVRVMQRTAMIAQTPFHTSRRLPRRYVFRQAN